MKQEELDSILASDKYHQKRAKITDKTHTFHLREVEYHCPLCGKELESRFQKKRNKRYEIAHIYPNRPTIEQYERLHTLERLGDNSESYENKIALCKDCHDQQDYHTTVEEYLRLLEIKKVLLKKELMQYEASIMNLEEEIEFLVKKIVLARTDSLPKLTYDAVAVKNKIENSYTLLLAKVVAYVINYYPYIQNLFNQMDGENHFVFSVLCGEIKNCFIKLNDITDDKELIFNELVKWIQTKTGSTSISACEAVISFFIQDCEVFYEITE